MQVTCKSCDKKQPLQPYCRRCGFRLMKLPEAIAVSLPMPEELAPLPLPAAEHIPTMREWQDELIRRTLSHYSVKDAEVLLKWGKTTLHRHAKRLGIKRIGGPSRLVRQ